MSAALAHAEAGFYVLPTQPEGRQAKNPGGYVGKGWAEKSSIESAQIEEWWDRWPNANIAIHTGPSGLTFFDLDVDEIPEELDWLRTGIVQFSRSESVNSERGHYGFFTGDEIFTSGKLKLSDGTQVGEIRSGNTVVIVAPSKHVHAETKKGQYRWREEDINTPIPKLPSEARKYLRAYGIRNSGDGNTTAMAGWCVEATDESVNEAIALWCNNSRPNSLLNLVNKVKNTKAGTRDETRDVLRIAASESRIGFYPLADVIEKIRLAMRVSYNQRGESEKFDDGEFWRLVRNGVGYAMSRDKSDISAEANRDYGAESDEDDFEVAVTQQIRKLEVLAEAKRRIRAKNRVPLSRTPMSLTEALKQPPNPTPMRIESVMQDGGLVMLAAQFKAGKTTAVGNLIRSLVDGDPFLGSFPVHKTVSRLVLIDTEMSQDMVVEWLRGQGIKNTDAVVDVICLRGQVESFDIFSDDSRTDWAKHLREIGCDYVILDCLSPIIDAFDMDENQDLGTFLIAFKSLLFKAGINGDSTIIHHMGHSAVRSRGSSKLPGGTDANWKLLRENPDDEFSPRYFSATGRDVEVQQGLLRYNPANRHLTYLPTNRADARKQRKVDSAVSAIARILTDDRSTGGTGLSGNQIEAEAIKTPNVTRQAVRDALKTGCETGELASWDGPRKAKIFSLATDSENHGKSSSPNPPARSNLAPISSAKSWRSHGEVKTPPDQEK